MDDLTRLLDSHGMLPHGFCLLWQPELLALHVVSDLAIALSYFSIPLAILGFMRRRTDLLDEHKRIAMLFVLFIMGCGLTHVMGIVVLWRPAYWTDGVIKAATAAVSIITAVALWPVIPRLVALPSTGQLEAANASLQQEIAARRQALDELNTVRANLEAEVQQRTAEAQALARRFQLATEGSVVTLFEQDEDLRFTWLHNPRPPFDRAGIGRTGAECLPPGTHAVLEPLKRQVMAGGEPLQTQVELPTDGEPGWFELRITSARTGEGERGVLTAAVDISEEKRQQEHLQVITRELAHRSRNLLSMVDGIARQTGKAEAIPPAFIEHFSERLSALGKAHDLLIGHDWRGISLASLVEGQLAPLAPVDRLRAEGPAIEVRPDVGQYLALALHELATNATKYGALSDRGGGITLTWREIDDGHIEVIWDEVATQSLPESETPRRRGFGRLLLEVLTPRAVKGRSNLEFRTQGPLWRIEFPK
jgi:two-component sensor histidine kinase